MGRISNRRFALIAGLAIVVSPVIWRSTAGARGNLQARYDVARGHYKVLQYGLPTLGFSEYRALLLRRYGVDVQPKGCVLTELSGPYSGSYNRVAVAAINKKFGHDVFAECWSDATRERLERTKADSESSARASEEAHPASSRQ
jgi:hypothetical protein